ncbi:peroxiredoxin [Candidatus Bathyarchaeota archaeon]|nr:peroxiredoxin [Candidatus Bathyarchaeota archaeon]NIR12756.1 peroxiredoxin [Desulfobacterales bacterium]NIU81341.1 peroxiredoxin [Candidatus Bathyarchaeota archaeon]NIV67981.1 peroxiredoxin [Candidatus Bathyarchaeota archaeon]NIW16417.1 peroxiredoxin [Candidatus Bathyarchaeota archaeon]
MSQNNRKLAIIVHSGTLDRLYCAFILGSTATAMDMETHLYFTFWGLNMLVKGEMEKAELPATYKHMEEKMKKALKGMKYPSPYDLLKRMKASGLLKIYACSPTMKMFNVKKEDLIPEVDEIAGAAAFLDLASDADVTLLV